VENVEGHTTGIINGHKGLLSRDKFIPAIGDIEAIVGADRFGDRQFTDQRVSTQTLGALLVRYVQRLPEVEGLRVTNADGMVVLGNNLGPVDIQMSSSPALGGRG
jgi:hypothetical protein